MPKRKSILKDACFLLAAVLCLSATRFTPVAAQQGAHPLTIADEIGLTFFGGPEGYGDPASYAVKFSPNGKYVAISTSHGDVAYDRVVADLRFYRSSDIERALDNPNAPPPVPVWSTSVWSEEGPVIGLWQWLRDSSGVAFIRRNPGGRKSLALADVANKTSSALSSENEDVGEYYFDINDRNDYAFTSVAVTTAQEKTQKRNAQTAILGTGHTIFDMVIPQSALSNANPVRFWVVTGGKRVEINAEANYLGLSPDGTSLAVSKPLSTPESWPALYLPPYVGDPATLHAGGQTIQYGRVDVQTSRIEPLIDAPAGGAVGWYAAAYASPSWSRDGKYVILPDTFLHADTPGNRPCIAVVDVASKAASCVEILKGHLKSGVPEEGYQYVNDVGFVGGDSQRVFVTYTTRDDIFAPSTTEYQRNASGTWEIVNVYKGVSAQELGPNGLRVTVKQSLNDPPQLVATNARGSHVIWDPNPQLKNFALGKVEVFHWKDQGQDSSGGLYLPAGYQPGERYPLVIQTHGFGGPSSWSPAGVFPTAFAATALASHGIMVLQTGGNCQGRVTPEEPACMVAYYAAGARKLIAQGMVDPSNIGLIGFSRTGMYVVKALTTNVLHLKAASITDSVMLDYFQYVLSPDHVGSEAEQMIGPPFGEGLQKWLQLSPSFNFDKATTPLLDIGLGPRSLLFMWLPYAMMHHLNKPVELVMLNMDDGPGTLPYEHVLTNPGFRLASQGGTVDWFRFWLQGYEDPDPARATQYHRWEKLRQLQQAESAQR